MRGTASAICACASPGRPSSERRFQCTHHHFMLRSGYTCSSNGGEEVEAGRGEAVTSRASIFSDQLKSAVRCAWKVYSGTAYPHDCRQRTRTRMKMRVIR